MLSQFPPRETQPLSVEPLVWKHDNKNVLMTQQNLLIRKSKKLHGKAKQRLHHISNVRLMPIMKMKQQDITQAKHND